MGIRVRKLLFVALALVVVLVLGVITMMGWEIVLGPDARTTTDRSFEATEARLERGRYLVEGPAACFHCHSEHDFTRPGYPIVDGMKGAGWEMPIEELGRVIAPNITQDQQTGIGAWTDDEIARAIQEGVSRDGRALFPVMPYPRYRELDEEDLASIVVYLRTIPPVRHARPRSELIFPLSLIVNTIPEPLVSHTPNPPRTTPEARGEYMVRTVATCDACHTPVDDQGTPLPGMAFGGGAVFHDPGRNLAPLHSLNVTFDASGISYFDESLFIEAMRTGQLPGRQLNPIMPFEHFRLMTDEDLLDTFAYLKSVPAVSHRISNTDPPTMCPICNQEHGLGEFNRKTN